MERSRQTEISLWMWIHRLGLDLGMIVEGERGNKDDDRFSGLINEWMVAPYDEMVKVPLFKVVEDKA